MKTFSLAALMGAVLTLIFAAQPAAAAIRCGCPPVVAHHHATHRVVRRHIVYRHIAPRVEYRVVYVEGPPPPPPPVIQPAWADYGPYDAAPQWYPGFHVVRHGFERRVAHWDEGRAHGWHGGYGGHHRRHGR